MILVNSDWMCSRMCSNMPLTLSSLSNRSMRRKRAAFAIRTAPTLVVVSFSSSSLLEISMNVPTQSTVTTVKSKKSQLLAYFRAISPIFILITPPSWYPTKKDIGMSNVQKMEVINPMMSKMSKRGGSKDWRGNSTRSYAMRVMPATSHKRRRVDVGLATKVSDMVFRQSVLSPEVKALVSFLRIERSAFFTVNRLDFDLLNPRVIFIDCLLAAT
mmetsp:Transcript_10794/g.20144  ORF Transcript_10794/g.20144 Transcript_10794/m.20144 type:complete len:215 (+) Transcript_10794:1226-1870(+)